MLFIAVERLQRVSIGSIPFPKQNGQMTVAMMLYAAGGRGGCTQCPSC